MIFLCVDGSIPLRAEVPLSTSIIMVLPIPKSLTCTPLLPATFCNLPCRLLTLTKVEIETWIGAEAVKRLVATSPFVAAGAAATAPPLPLNSNSKLAEAGVGCGLSPGLSQGTHSSGCCRPSGNICCVSSTRTSVQEMEQHWIEGRITLEERLPNSSHLLLAASPAAVQCAASTTTSSKVTDAAIHTINLLSGCRPGVATSCSETSSHRPPSFSDSLPLPLVGGDDFEGGPGEEAEESSDEDLVYESELRYDMAAYTSTQHESL